MKLESRSLSGTPFAEAWLRRDAPAASLMPADPAELATYRERASEIDEQFDEPSRAAAAAYLFGGGSGADARRDAFVRERGYMVTTGQQPGLFGGPLFALYKGLTAAALARRLEAALGRPVLPVFWIASEHHVWEDLGHAHVIDAENQLQEVTLGAPAGSMGRPVHRIRTGEELQAALDRFLSLHPESEFSPRWKALLREGYPPGATLAEGFAHVMGELLGESGVFLVHAHEPELKERSLPILLEELRSSEERERELQAFDTRVRSAGFEPQVPFLAGATNLFYEGSHGRERLFRDGSAFRLRGSEERVRIEEVEARAKDNPSVLSPNVLLRPVVEGSLLPTLSYVAGPGEMAYFPHTAPVFAAHGIAGPVVHPRAALWAVERKVAKVLKKFGLELEDLALPAHELSGRLARDEMPASVDRALESLRTGLRKGAGELAGAASEIDATLRGPIESFESQSQQLLGDLERKILQSLKRENEVAFAQADKIRVHLFPLSRPQERVLNPFYYLVRYDQAFLASVNERVAQAVLV